MAGAVATWTASIRTGSAHSALVCRLRRYTRDCRVPSDMPRCSANFFCVSPLASNSSATRTHSGFSRCCFVTRRRVRLHRHLGKDLAHVTALRAGGAELKAIAVDQQVAISTAHHRVATAVQRIRSHARRRGIGPTSLDRVLTAL